jgi:hypothetical protein
MYFNAECAERVDQAMLLLAEGLASKDRSAWTRSADEFVRTFQNRGPDEGFYHGSTPDETYNPWTGHAWTAWFPCERKLDDYEPARKELFDLLLLVPAFAYSEARPLQLQEQRRTLLRHCATYLQLRDRKVPAQVALALVDTLSDTFGESVRPPRNNLALRVLAHQRQPKYRNMTEAEAAEALARDDENVETALRALLRYRQRCEEAVG